MNASYDSTARRQHGLVTTAQLVELGWTKWAIRHAVHRGRLEAVRRGTYRVAGAPPSQEQAWLAAVLGSGPGAVLSHGSATRLWGLPRFPEAEEIDVLVPPGRARPRLDGVRGHQTRSLPDHHRTMQRRVPVTTPERTLIDACGLLTFPLLERATDEGLRRGTLRLPDLARAVDEVPVSGRRRIRPVIDLLRERVPGYDPGASPPEIDLVELLSRAGFPRPDQQIRVRTEGHTYFIDVGWADHRVGFEYESVEFHHSVSAFHGDRERLRRLKRAGWDIWPVTSRTTVNEILAIATLAFRQSGAA